MSERVQRNKTALVPIDIKGENILNRLLLLGAVSALALSTPAFAVDPLPADPGAAPADVQGEAPGEILVTARRRSEAVQSVPLAISVVDANTINSTGAFNIFKLTQIQPTLQFYSTNPRNTTVNIRGLGQPFGLINDGIEPGVGFYIDEVYYARPGSATFDFLDIERVEVLRGPQGTLYGKNTTAGAINITTKAPSFTPQGAIEVSAGNLGFVQGKASVSGPLSDRLAVRLGVSATKRNGTIFNVTTKHDVNSQDNLGLRGTVLWRATDTLDLTFSGDYNRQNPDCCVQIYVRTGATQRPLNRQFAALAAAFNYAPPSTNAFDRVTDLDAPLQAKQIIGGASVKAKLDTGSGTLTSVTAWRFWDWTPQNDRDFTGLPITTVSQNPSRQEQWTQEFRYAGTTGKLDYVAGLYGFHQKIDTSGSQAQGSAASRWLLNPGASVPVGSAACAPVTANACNPAILNGLTSVNDIHFKNDSFAAFGQLTWHVTDRLRLQPGVRINYDKKTGSYVATVFTGTGSTTLNSDQLGVLAPQSYQPRFSDWKASYDFTASYDVSKDVLAYATYAKSFKSGGINLSGLPLNSANTGVDLSTQTVRPENVNHFELGLKTQFLDHRVTFNLAGFWTDIKDFQATVNNGQITVIRGYLANAGKVRSRGIEVDFSARPTDLFSTYFSGAFTDAKYVKFVNAPCPPELSGGNPALNGATPAAAGVPGLSPLVCDISGQWLPGVSRWAFSHGGEYRVPAAVLGAPSEVYIGYDGSYRSKYSSNPSRSAYTDIAGYYLANIRAGVRIDKKWELFGWVRNVFDKNYYEVLATQSGSTGLIVGQPADPRTYGITASARF
jgi:iron complex outermembrane receptor protein